MIEIKKDRVLFIRDYKVLIMELQKLILITILLSSPTFAATISATNTTTVNGESSLGSTPLITRDTLLFNTDLNDESCIADSQLAVNFNISGAGRQTLRISQPAEALMYSPETAFALSGTYTLVNKCGHAITGNWQFSRNGQVLYKQAFALSPATICSLTLPDSVDLGTFNTTTLVPGLTSERKIALSGQCTTAFSITFSGTGSGEGNFKLGEDVEMGLSYGAGSQKIINGQAFSPSVNQVVDVYLSALNGIPPAAGKKNTALTVRLDLL